MIPHLPEDWFQALQEDAASAYYAKLSRFVAAERKQYEVYPPEDDIFTTLQLTRQADVRVVIMGQDPYHGPGQAHGLSFSVRPGVAKPPSLVNILRELVSDTGCPVPLSGCLSSWARQGVLLLNAVLTVRAGQPNSHRGRGWERFTDTIIRTVNDNSASSVFLLWGANAQRKVAMLDTTRHAVISIPHPSPLSAHTGFFGSRPFTRANAALIERGLAPIDWRLQDASGDQE